MADCVNLDDCGCFYKLMASMPGISGMYKKRYCKGNYSKCARYQVFEALGKENVPIGLYPNMHDRVEKIIEEYKNSGEKTS